MTDAQPELGRRLIEAARDVEPVTIRQGDLIRQVWVRAEFDCRGGTCAFDDPGCVPGTGGSHGQGSRSLFFGVGVAGRGGVTAELMTPICATEAGTEDYLENLWRPMGCIDLHVPSTAEGAYECEILGGELCYVEWGTALQPDLTAEIFLERGVEGVWSWLGEAWLPRVLER